MPAPSDSGGSQIPGSGNGSRPPPPRISWQRNLVFVWLSQLLSISGFNFALPFVSYYMQEDLGVTDQEAVKLYTGVFMGGASLAMAFAAPIWGMLADRYGRRLMMLRANFSGAVIIFSMGLVSSVGQLLALRFLQGALTGTVTAALTLVAVSTPERRHGLAFGALSSAVFGGMLTGALLGGMCADAFGYATSFKLSGGLLFTSGCLIVFGVREDFQPPLRDAAQTVPRRRRLRLRLPRLGPALPLLVLMLFTSFSRRFITPILPLFVQHLHGGTQGAATINGQLQATGAVACMLAGLTLSRLADHVAPPRIGRLSAIGAALFAGLMGVTAGFGWLFVAFALCMFWAGGLDPVFQVWLTRNTPPEKRGGVLGWSVTFKSLGWLTGSMGAVFLAVGTTRASAAGWLGPAPGGSVQLEMGYRAVFLGAAVAYLVILPLVGWAVRSIISSRGAIEPHDVPAHERAHGPPAPAEDEPADA